MIVNEITKKAVNILIWGGGLIGALSSVASGNSINAIMSIVTALIGTELITQYRIGKLEATVSDLKEQINSKKSEENKNG